MHIYTAIVICIVFVSLMTVVIVNETLSVVEVLSTLVSSVDIISLTGPHRHSMIGLSGKYLNETSFDISNYCNCQLESSDSKRNCSSTIFRYRGEDGTHDSDTTHVLFLTEGPTDWQKREATVFDCYHDFIPLITYLVVPQSFSEFSVKLESTVGDVSNATATDFLDDNVFHSPSPWINSNTINQVLLSREDHYLRHKLDKSYIKTIVSQASHNEEGFTQITFSWREGQVTKIDKFSNGSYWSLATLMCTVLLGVERCLAFINRAKNKTPVKKVEPIQVQEADKITTLDSKTSEGWLGGSLKERFGMGTGKERLVSRESSGASVVKG